MAVKKDGVKYHISPDTGRPNQCKADKRDCPIPNSPHFSTKETAREFFEKSKKGMEFPTISSKNKGRKPKVEEPTPVVEEVIESTNVDVEPDLIEIDGPSDADKFEEIEIEYYDFDDDFDGSSDDGCDQCSDNVPSVKYRKDPYEEYAHGEIVYRYLCDDCYGTLASTY